METSLLRAGRWRLAAFLTLLLTCAGCAGGAAPGAQPSSGSAGGATAPRTPISVVAAENFYGDVVTQIAGGHVKVTSILSDPSVDPHLYESNVDTAKAVANAQLVVLNGAGYDAFMDKLLAASPKQNRVVIDAGKLTATPAGANPHLWYQPATMPAVAQALADGLAKIDPADRDDFDAGLQRFTTAMKPLQDEIAAIKARHAGARVLPTEPVFDYMAEALGLSVVDKEGTFQKAVEAGNDPPASAVAQFRQQLTTHAIKALIYNSQTITPITTDMQNVARQSSVPVVGVYETEPSGKTYQQWQTDQLLTLQKSLES